MNAACSPNGEKRNAYRLLVGKPEGKKPLGRSRHVGGVPDPLLSRPTSSGNIFNSSQVRVTGVTKANGNCILEASPLLRDIDTATGSTVHKLFIYS
jgi:hypothetical protein